MISFYLLSKRKVYIMILGILRVLYLDKRSRFCMENINTSTDLMKERQQLFQHNTNIEYNNK